jgi:hypothetical protein
MGFACQNRILRSSVILPVSLSSVAVVEPDFNTNRLDVLSTTGMAVSPHCPNWQGYCRLLNPTNPFVVKYRSARPSLELRP